MAWTKAKTAAVATLAVIVAAGTGTVIVRNTYHPTVSEPMEEGPMAEVAQPVTPVEIVSEIRTIPVPQEPIRTLSILDELRQCLQETSENTRHRKFLELLDTLQASDARGFMNVLAEYRSAGLINLDFERDAFWRRRAQLDPQQALADLEALSRKLPPPAIGPDGRPLLGSSREERDLLNAFGQFFRSWAASDPQSARDWLNTHGEHPQYAAAFAGFVDSYAATDPAGATEFLLSSGSPDDVKFTVAARRICAQVIHRGDAAAATRWFEQLPTDDAGVGMRRSVVGDIAGRLIDQDLSAARTWVGEQAGKPWRHWPSIDAVATRYAADDPAAAMAWITTLAPDPHNGSITGVGTVVRNWFDRDPAGLERWLWANQPSGSRAFAQAAGECAVMSAPNDYNRALEWLNQIPPQFPNVRQNFQRQVEAHAPKPAQASR